MAVPSDDIHDPLLEEIDARIGTLGSGATMRTSDGAARTHEEVDLELAQLQGDRSTLLAHWRFQDGLSGLDEPPRARACGQPQPCPHVMGLVEKYKFV